MKNFLTAKNSLFAAVFSRHKFKPFRPEILAAACGLVVALTALPAHAQNCAPPPSGLVGWWPLEETAGAAVADRSPLQNPGIVGFSNGNSTSIGTGSQSTPKSVTGFVGNGMNFYFGSRVKVKAHSSLDFGKGKSFTIDAWVKGRDIYPIVGNYDSGATDYFSLWNDGGRLRFDMAGSKPVTSWYGPAITRDEWTFVAVVVDRTSPKKTVTLYTNTDMSGTAAVPPIPNVANAGTNLPLYIGGCPGNPNGCDAVIDEVEVFNRALTPREIQSIYNAGSAGKCKQTAAIKKGMTWLHSTSNPTTGTITVGCAGCDAHKGDTACTEKLPLLCIYKPTPPFPLPAGVSNADQYSQWSGGVVATTAPVAGNSLAHSTDATAHCVAQFGPNWRVAEFHDGQYWNFQAYGGTVKAPTVPSTRFWVHINDQKDGTCWLTP